MCVCVLEFLDRSDNSLTDIECWAPSNGITSRKKTIDRDEQLAGFELAHLFEKYFWDFMLQLT